MILNFRKGFPARESKRLSIMPFQTLSMKQSKVAEFGIARLTKKLDVTKSVKLFKWMFKNALFMELKKFTHSTDINGE